MPDKSGEEIKGALKVFVGRWKDYTRTERAEAQTFLNVLFEAYGNSRKADGETIGFLKGFIVLYG